MKKSLPVFAALLTFVFLCAIPVSSAEAPNDLQLVAHYPLDGNAEDASGHGLHGQLHGTAPAPDRFGETNRALFFNGATDWIDLGNRPEFNFSSNFTITAWVKANGLQVATYIVAKYLNVLPSLPHSYGLGTQFSDRGEAYGFVSGYGPGYIDTFGGPSLHDGAWHSLALVYDASSGLRLYTDGQLVGQRHAPNLPPFTNTPSLSIGALADGQHFGGWVDDVRIYATALSAEQLDFSVPLILAAPQPAEVPSGGAVQLHVAAQGPGTLAYQWFFNGRPLPGATNDTLALSNFRAANEGFYSVRVSNAWGGTTSAEVPVRLKPSGPWGAVRFSNRVPGEPEATVTDPYGDPLVGTNWLIQLFAGSSASGPMPIGLPAPFGDGPSAGFFDDGLREIFGLPPGAVTTVSLRVWERSAGFTFSNAVANGGAYGISSNFSVTLGTIETGGGPMGNLRSFAVLGPPRFIVQPPSRNVQEGANVDFAGVGIGGTFPMTFQWLKNGTNLPGATQMVLLIENASFADAGVYTLIAANAFGSAQSEPATLTVLALDTEPPVLTIVSPTNTVSEASSINLAGSVQDNQGIDRVLGMLNGGASTPLALDSEGRFSVVWPLAGGTNVVRLDAYDLQGNKASTNLSIFYRSPREIFLVDQPPVREGSTVSLPVMLRSYGDVGSIDFSLMYPASILTPVAVRWSVDQPGMLTQVNTNTQGNIRLSLALPGGTITNAETELGVVEFRVRSVPNATTALISPRIQGVFDQLGNPLPAASVLRGASFGVLKRLHIGDNNGNNILDVGDASAMLRWVAGLEPLRTWDVAGNDLNGNRQVDAGDVTRVLRAVVKLDPQPGATNLVAPLAAPPSGLSLSADSLRLIRNQRVKVRLNLDGAFSNVAGASFSLSFPTNTLWLESASSIRLGALIPSGSFTLWNLEPGQNDFSIQTGDFHFAVSSPAPWLSSQGELLELTFLARENIAPAGATIHVTDLQLTDGFSMLPLADAQLQLHSAEPVSPSISRAVRNGDGQFEFTASGEASARYAVESSSDLADWQQIGTAENASGALTFRDPITGAARFYRLRQVE